MKDVSDSACVLDASVALSWILDDEAVLCLSILQEKPPRNLIVPPHWVAETLNGIRYAVKRGKMHHNCTHEALAFMQQIPFKIVSIPFFDWASLMDNANTYSLSIYDTSYLYLAQKHDLPLATADKALQRAASALNISLVPL